MQTIAISQGGVTADTDRTRRTGFPEVIYAEGKPIDSLLTAIDRILSSLTTGQHQEVLVTRVNVEQARAIGDQFAHVRWNSRSRTIRINVSQEPESWESLDCPIKTEPMALATGDGAATFSSGQLIGQSIRQSDGDVKSADMVVVVTAGTTDSNVAEEALETLAWMGVRAGWIQDVGVAGPFRILSRLTQLREAKSIVVVAGMEGALASVVAGYVGVPIFAVPTSVGYGVSFGGLSALLTMLNSCASNVAAVNIDGGFRGGFLAGLVAAPRRK